MTCKRVLYRSVWILLPYFCDLFDHYLRVVTKSVLTIILIASRPYYISLFCHHSFNYYY